MKVRDLDEVMEFQQGNHRAIKEVSVFSPLSSQRFKGLFLQEGGKGKNFQNDMSVGAGLTLHLHSPRTVAFHYDNKCFEPLWRRGV